MLNLSKYKNIVFFSGAGMSAEIGVPTYRGSGGIWQKYNYQEYACQQAFDNNPQKVMEFHELRRRSVLKCNPHAGHVFITELQNYRDDVSIITQNIDGMHQRSAAKNVIELHGSLWRLRCDNCGIIIEDSGEKFNKINCECGIFLRPDIVWFGDPLNLNVIQKATEIVQNCGLFISVGTSGVVWPAAGFPAEAKNNGAYCIELNTEPTNLSALFDETINCKASEVENYFTIKH